MCERILAQNCQKFDNFNFEFSMSHHNAHYQSYKNAPGGGEGGGEEVGGEEESKASGEEEEGRPLYREKTAICSRMPSMLVCLFESCPFVIVYHICQPCLIPGLL